MADTTASTTPAAATPAPATPAAKPAARKPATRRPAAKTGAAKTTARRTRTTARKETGEAAKAGTRAVKATATEGRTYVERAALTYVGATLVARDRVVEMASDLADKYGSRTAAERELELLRKDLRKDMKRFERRGYTARTDLERSAKRARTHVERELRTRRADLERILKRGEREVAEAERDAEKKPNVVTDQIATVTGRVEDAVQASYAVGEKIVKTAREQLNTLA